MQFGLVVIDVLIPNSVKEIGGYAFQNCRSLTNVTIPVGVASIGVGAFDDCVSLTSIIIPDGVTNINAGVFCGCGSMTSVTIPDGVISIGDYAFYGCTSLNAVFYRGEQNDRNGISVGNSNEYLQEADWHYQVEDADLKGRNCYYCADCNKYFLPNGDSVAHPGDANDDGILSDADALYLLRHTLFPGRYPINQSGDMNGDSQVTDADALYLLRHTLFPARYPLR